MCVYILLENFEEICELNRSWHSFGSVLFYHACVCVFVCAKNGRI